MDFVYNLRKRDNLIAIYLLLISLLMALATTGWVQDIAYFFIGMTTCQVLVTERDLRALRILQRLAEQQNK